MSLRIAIPLIALLFVAPVSAQVVTITKIADTATIAPGGSAYTAFGAFPSMDGSTVAFSGTSAGVAGLYTGSGGTISTIVAPGSAIPNGTGNFTALNASFRYDAGSVSFVGTGASPAQSGIYTSNGTTISRVADLNTAIPSGAGNFTSFSPFPSQSNGVVSFSGAGTSQSGIYSTATGSLAAVADLTTAAPGTAGNFTGFGSNPSVSGTTTVFRASSSLGSFAGIYARTGSGAVTTVADINSTVPGGTFTTGFSEPSISGSNVAVIDNNGVFARIAGNLVTIANTSTPSPNGTGNFSAITTYAPIDGSSIAFIGSTATSKGIYLFSGGVLYDLVDNTTGFFDGKPLGASPFFLGIDAISANHVTFEVLFTTGNGSGIYEATLSPVPEPSTLALAGLGATLVFRRRKAVRMRAV